MNAFAPGMEEVSGANFRTKPGIAGAVTGNVRSQQRVEAQFPAQGLIQHFDFGMHQQNGSVRIGEHVFYQPVAALAFRVGKAVKRAIALRVFDPVVQVAFFLVAKGFAIGDEELEVARVGLIHMRIVNLIDDAVAEREPEPATGMIGRAHAFFRARSPARLDSGRSKRDENFGQLHIMLSLSKNRTHHPTLHTQHRAVCRRGERAGHEGDQRHDFFLLAKTRKSKLGLTVRKTRCPHPGEVSFRFRHIGDEFSAHFPEHVGRPGPN